MVKKEDSKLYAFVATFLSVVGFLIAILTWRKNKYVIFYAKQSLIIFIIAVGASIISGVLGWIPVIGWIISTGLNIIVFIIWLLSWINALSGKKKDMPVIGMYAKKIDL
jgi:uncharacterized membrane protein